jgi:cytochrome c oxidase subunit 2
MVVLKMRGTEQSTRTWGPLAIVALLAAICLLPRVAGSKPASEREEIDRVISIVAERFTFVPSEVKLKQGEVVELRIRSLDTNHGFHIRDAGVNVIVPKRGKGDARILFRAREAGEFPFECSKACGAGHTMMRGRIVVE